MTYPIVLLWLFGALFAAYLLFQMGRSLRRRGLERRLETMPFPETYRVCLQRIAHYNALSATERRQIERAILQFLHTKNFSGVGMRVTDEMRLLVAFYASLITLYREGEPYANLSDVILYARGFVVEEEYEDGGIVSSGEFELDGQSSPDTVILSWEDAEAESYGLHPYNVIIHEFAHVLDFADGAAEGMRTEYEAFTQALQEGGEASRRYERFDDYTAYDEVEFFAVSSERFFQCPAWLHQRLPSLFGLLQRFYGTDPRRWDVEADPERP
jgi:Mlc titration factor MtfA (ptsG expression regulator)